MFSEIFLFRDCTVVMAPTPKRPQKRCLTKRKTKTLPLKALESAALVKHYRNGAHLYKRFGAGRELSLTAMKDKGDVQWFALESEYGAESYGPIVFTYVVKNQPRLINVGSDSVRQELKKRAEIGEGRPLNKEFNADEQWSGGAGNHVFTNLVRKYFGREYDGTIVVEGSPATDEENEGATEITLWRNFSQIVKKV